MLPGFLFHQAELTIPNMPSRKNSTSLSVVSGENSHDTVDLFLRAELGNCAFRDAVGFHTLAGIAEQESSAKRDRCPDVAAHPDFVFRPGRPERLEATWCSLARVLGVLELLGTSLRVLLYPVSGEASGRPPVLHSDSGCSRTHTEVARSSGTTGPGALLHTAPSFSFALPRRSIPLFAGALIWAAPALFLTQPRRSISRCPGAILSHHWCAFSRCNAAILLAVPALSFLPHRGCAKDCPGDAKTIAPAQHETHRRRGEKDSAVAARRIPLSQRDRAHQQ